jgi:ferritin-like metal-binding protein YciE
MALKDVLIDELRDMYSAENQLVKSMPKLAKGAESRELKDLFKEHLEQTKGQIQRLRQAFEHLGKKPTGKHCMGMEGVIAEGMEALEEDMEGASFDSGIIGAAMRVEHYEVAGYHACIAMAKAMGMREVVDLLKQNLEEEIDMAKRVQAASKEIFKQAMQEEEEDEDPKPAAKKSAKDKEAERKSKEDERQAGSAMKKSAKTAAKTGARRTAGVSGLGSQNGNGSQGNEV